MSNVDKTEHVILAWTAFWKLENIWRSRIALIATKIKLFIFIWVSVLLYGYESWVLYLDMEGQDLLQDQDEHKTSSACNQR